MTRNQAYTGFFPTPPSSSPWSDVACTRLASAKTMFPSSSPAQNFMLRWVGVVR